MDVGTGDACPHPPTPPPRGLPARRSRERGPYRARLECTPFSGPVAKGGLAPGGRLARTRRTAMPRGRTHSREFKLDLMHQVASGAKRPAQLCRGHGLANSVLDRWRHEYAERGEAVFTPREVA